jgi:hypothetical protein
MARADESRFTVRCSHEEREAIDRAARVAGVATGALARECALRWGPVLAAEIVSRGEIKLRGRNVPRAEPAPCFCQSARGVICVGCRAGVRAVTPLGPRREVKETCPKCGGKDWRGAIDGPYGICMGCGFENGGDPAYA